MKIIQLIRLRLNRGFSIQGTGPNEARFLYDGAWALVAGLCATVFCADFAPSIDWVRGLELTAVLCFFFLLFNLILGVYSHFRLALARVKALVLCASVILSVSTAWAIFRDLAPVVLWAMLVTGPVAVARLLLSLNTGRHRALARIATNEKGPVLVIGGAGYIGSHAVDQLLRAGHEVRVLDRLMYGEASLAEFRGNKKFNLIDGDVTDIAKLTMALKDCSAVVHLAGLVGDPACAVSPEFTRHTNIIATRMARQVAEAMGVRKFIFASSCSVYGMSDTAVDETDALNPVSLYAETKIDSEKELLANVSDDFFVTILRFATVFGHSRRPRFDLVGNLFTAQAMMDGLITVVGPNQWRPFIHVRDLARSIVAVLNADERLVQSQVFNVGDERLNLTILQLAEAVKKVVSSRKPVDISVTENPLDRRNYCVAFTKIQKTLGFHAATLVEDGVEEMVSQFQAKAYEHYRSARYSNVAMTAKAVEAFHDPDQTAHLYAPVGQKI